MHFYFLLFCFFIDIQFSTIFSFREYFMPSILLLSVRKIILPRLFTLFLHSIFFTHCFLKKITAILMVLLSLLIFGYFFSLFMWTGNMSYMIPNFAMMSFVGYFFSGFVCLKMPFSLPSTHFKVISCK